jgi:hypothetical protein
MRGTGAARKGGERTARAIPVYPRGRQGEDPTPAFVLLDAITLHRNRISVPPSRGALPSLLPLMCKIAANPPGQHAAGRS